MLTGREWGIMVAMFDSCARLSNLDGVLPPPLGGTALRRLLQGSERDVPLGVFEGRLVEQE